MTNEEAIKYLKQIHPVGGHCWLDEQRIKAIDMAIEALTKASEEKEPVSEDLEEASKEWLIPQLDKSYASYGENMMMELTHFDGYAMLDAIEFGAQWQKQQLMKSAVKGVVHHFGDDEIATIHYNDPKGVPMSYFVSSNDLKAGDNVKMITIKEE